MQDQEIDNRRYVSQDDDYNEPLPENLKKPTKDSPEQSSDSKERSTKKKQKRYLDKDNWASKETQKRIQKSREDDQAKVNLQRKILFENDPKFDDLTKEDISMIMPFKYHELQKPNNIPSIDENDRKSLFRSLMQRKHLDFSDAINDCCNNDKDSILDAIGLFQDPFRIEREFYQECVQNGENPWFTIRQGNDSCSITEPTGTMRDYWLLYDIPDSIPVIENDEHIKDSQETLINRNLGRKNGLISHGNYVDPLILKFQLYMLAATDGAKRNVMHMACKNGLRIICRFLIQKAVEFDCTNQLLLQEDNKSMRPIYKLALNGFDYDKEDEFRMYRSRIHILKLLQLGHNQSDIVLDKKENIVNPDILPNSSWAKIYDWLRPNPQINYTPLHWFCYWDDYRCVRFLLNIASQDRNFDFDKLLTKTEDGLTPLDVAGKHRSDKAALIMLDWYKNHFYMIAKYFKDEIQNEQYQKKCQDYINEFNKNGLTKSWKINHIKAKMMQEHEQHVLSIMYWAAFYDHRDLVILFLEKLGISPFMKLFKGTSAIDACILGEQYEMLELLIRNTKEGSVFTDKNNNTFQKYTCPEDRDLFMQTRKKKDFGGNNSCHYAFAIDYDEGKNTLTKRYKFIQLLVDENVGDMGMANHKGQEPYEIEHTHPMPGCPKSLVDKYLLGERQENEEADYLIVTRRTRLKLVLDQLEDLGYIALNKYNPEISKLDPQPVKVYNIKDGDTWKSLISIKVPQKDIDSKAEKAKLECTITNLEIEQGVQQPFNSSKSVSPYFNKFGAVQECEAVEETLKEQIDFDMLMEMGIIEDHFHLHKKDNIESIEHATSKYQWKLIQRMMCCQKYFNKMQPLNMMKDYLGDKIAYEQAFLLNYIAWLHFPALLGLIIIAYQVYYATTVKTGTFINAFLDTQMNGFFGIIMALWATVFVEYWKRNEAYLKFYWNSTSENENSQADQADDFFFYRVFNKTTDRVQKERVELTERTQYCYLFIYCFLMAIIMAFTIFYYDQKFKLNYDYDKVNERYVRKPNVSSFISIAYSTVFSIFSMVFKIILTAFIHYWVDEENHQYRTKQRNSLVIKLFYSNMVILYLPLFIILAQVAKYEDKFYDLASLTVTNLLFTSFFNVYEYVYPLVMFKGKITSLKQKYWPIREKFWTDQQKREKSSAEGMAITKFVTNQVGAIENSDEFEISKESKLQRKTQVDQSYLTSSESETSSSSSSDDGFRVKKYKGKKQSNIKTRKTKEQIMDESKSIVRKLHELEKNEDKMTIRRYQAERDYAMDPQPPQIENQYMELILQFGFVALFSFCFPGAPFISLITNYGQVFTQINNIQFTRRFKAEPASGIGAWQTTLEFIAQLSIIINCFQVYFTDSVYTNMFVGLDYKQQLNSFKTIVEKSLSYTTTSTLTTTTTSTSTSTSASATTPSTAQLQKLFPGLKMDDGTGEKSFISMSPEQATQISSIVTSKPSVQTIKAAQVKNVPILTPQWDLATFILCLIIIEHILLILRIVIEQCIQDKPQVVIDGEQQVEQIERSFKKLCVGKQPRYDKTKVIEYAKKQVIKDQSEAQDMADFVPPRYAHEKQMGKFNPHTDINPGQVKEKVKNWEEKADQKITPEIGSYEYYNQKKYQNQIDEAYTVNGPLSKWEERAILIARTKKLQDDMDFSYGTLPPIN